VSSVTTDDGTVATEDWFAVNLPQPVPVARIVFSQSEGTIWEKSGGWFDTSAGKPRIQVRRENSDKWETVGELSGYPVTDASSAPRIPEATPFTLGLETPVRATAVRVIGAPSHGKNTGKNFAICSELQLYVD